MKVIIDYGDSKKEFSNVRYNVCKALEEIMYEMEFGSHIISKEVLVEKLNAVDLEEE